MSGRTAQFMSHAGMQKYFPFLLWRDRITPQSLRLDLTAGITGAILAIPQGVAFAAIAGMPPEYGLYSGMVPAVIAALFGSSWHLVSGPTTAASIVIFSILSGFAEPGSASYIQLAFTLTFLVGVMELLLGVFRLGIVIQFVSHSVVTGFTAGAALLIATQQVRHFFGLHPPAGLSFWQTWHYLVSVWSHIDQATLYVSLATVSLGVVSRRYFPRLPYMLVALLGGALVSVALKSVWPEGTGALATVGRVPTSFPPLTAPTFDPKLLLELLTPAMAVTLLALTEAVSIARAMASRSGQRVDGNQEFIGQGLSNLVGSCFSSYVATGSFNRSGVNFASGARTPLAAVMGGVFLLLLTPLAAPLLEHLPNAAMAGVLVIVAWTLIDVHHIRHVAQNSRSELAIVGITFLTTLFVGLEEAILLGAFISLVLYLRRTSHPRVVVRTPNAALPRRAFSSDTRLPQCPQLGFIRVDGSIYYGAIAHVQERLETFGARMPHLGLVCSGINFIDFSGAELLADEARRRHARGQGFYLIRVKQPMLAMLEENGALEVIGRENIFSTKHEAIAAIFTRLRPDICRGCSTRIFLECPAVTPATAVPSPREGGVGCLQPTLTMGRVSLAMTGVPSREKL